MGRTRAHNYRYSMKSETLKSSASLLNENPTKPFITGARKTIVTYALRLRGIRVCCCIGVTELERARPQELCVDVDVEFDGECYPFGDDIAFTVDYSKMVSIVAESVNGSSECLLESYALRIARRLEGKWPGVEKVRVAVTKTHVPTSLPVDEAKVEVVLGTKPTA
jgi:dihydroneopterin aldolase